MDAEKAIKVEYALDQLHELLDNPVITAKHKSLLLVIIDDLSEALNR